MHLLHTIQIIQMNTSYSNNPASGQISTPQAPTSGMIPPSSSPSGYALPTQLQPAVNSAPSMQPHPPVPPNAATSSTLSPPLPPVPLSSLTVDARKTLRPILGPTGHLAQYEAQYQRGRNLFSPLAIPYWHGQSAADTSYSRTNAL